MRSAIHYCVLRTDTGDAVYKGRMIVAATHAMNVGTVWGSGFTPEEASMQAKRRLDALNESIARCAHPLDNLRIYQEPEAAGYSL